ncbi:type IV toxin-antitoxin system AbiEi family antitoxin domain-containing protein [Nocardioides sambongensis]|uniref:type IV toxin-antitoxin system AbiEi family antitoxin domain-containing protein n=1 Tax=Nocardioides sambongensis TaxID=2589074 RepID=UPI001128EB6C|nr:type IV toxin-antitoxin system AbiEi family antitoxin domain-containing protein [Nocardioides sambongensis]
MTLFSTIDLRHDHLLMTHELIASGYDDRAIRRLVDRRVLRRIGHGAYLPTDHWDGLSEPGRRRAQALAALRRAKQHVVLAGPSAADQYDVPVWDMGSKVHLARVDRRAGRSSEAMTQHRPAFVAEDITVRNGIPLTSGTRTALDMIALADVPHALVTVNGLLHAGETTMEDLERRVRGMRHDPHTLATPVVLALADRRCESAGESLALHLCWTGHLPRPELQYEVRDRHGRIVARLDFAWPELGLFMEFDGRAKYERHRRDGESVADAVLREKAREDLVRELTGWRCIRIVWADLFRPTATVGRIHRAMAAGRRAA